MAAGRALLMTLALLSYLGQSLVFAGVGHQQPDATDVIQASSHSMNGMDAEMTDHSEMDCCTEDCQCPGDGCQPVAPLIAASIIIALPDAKRGWEYGGTDTVSLPFFRYRPPIHRA
ncbi:MAG: hypothetical protein HOC23_14195 [Halieaceae bacterium]|jgi:hypothetical protein|nr:hypothetical protein [Halieaceae bacterium]